MIDGVDKTNKNRGGFARLECLEMKDYLEGAVLVAKGRAIMSKARHAIQRAIVKHAALEGASQAYEFDDLAVARSRLPPPPSASVLAAYERAGLEVDLIFPTRSVPSLHWARIEDAGMGDEVTEWMLALDKRVPGCLSIRPKRRLSPEWSKERLIEAVANLKPERRDRFLRDAGLPISIFLGLTAKMEMAARLDDPAGGKDYHLS